MDIGIGPGGLGGGGMDWAGPAATWTLRDDGLLVVGRDGADRVLGPAGHRAPELPAGSSEVLVSRAWGGLLLVLVTSLALLLTLAWSGAGPVVVVLGALSVAAALWLAWQVRLVLRARRGAGQSRDATVAATRRLLGASPPAEDVIRLLQGAPHVLVLDGGTTWAVHEGMLYTDRPGSAD